MSQYDPQGGYNNPYPPNSGGGAYGGQPYGTPPPNSGTPYGAPPSTGAPYGAPNTGDPYGGGGFNLPPSGPPPKKKRGGAIAIIVVVVLVLGCLGGIGYGVYSYISWANKLGTTAANALPSTSASAPAATPSPTKKRTGEGDGATVAVGQCVSVRKEGPSDNYVDIAPGCAKGTYKVVARFDHTTLTSKCEKTDADTTYEYDSSRLASSYVLCLKEQK